MKIYPLHSNGSLFVCSGDLNTLEIRHSGGQLETRNSYFPFTDWKVVDKIHPDGHGTDFTALDVNGHVISGPTLVKVYKSLEKGHRLANFADVQIVCQYTKSGALKGTKNPSYFGWSRFFAETPPSGADGGSSSSVDLAAELKKEQAEMVKKDEMIAKKDKEMEAKNQELEIAKGKMEKLNAAVKERDEEAKKKNQELDVKNDKIKELNAIIKKKEDEIATSASQLNSLESRIESFTKKNQELQGLIKEFEDKIEKINE
ncbi:hypothetical protein LINPERPRIM_LOCUS39904 [Linum perenne]